VAEPIPVNGADVAAIAGSLAQLAQIAGQRETVSGQRAADALEQIAGIGSPVRVPPITAPLGQLVEVAQQIAATLQAARLGGGGGDGGGTGFNLPDFGSLASILGSIPGPLGEAAELARLVADFLAGPAHSPRSPISLEAIISRAVQAAPGHADTIAGAFGNIWDQIKHGIDWFLNVEKPTRPEDALTHAVMSLAMASTLGIAAHGVSAALSVDVLGCLDLNTTGLAAMLSEASGFAPIIHAIQGPAIAASIARPWQRHVNANVRDRLPDALTAIKMAMKGKLPPGERVEDLMAWDGWDVKWLRALTDEVVYNPGFRELTLLAEIHDRPDVWWVERLRDLGIRQEQEYELADALKRRRAQSYINSLVKSHRDAYVDGFMDEADLRRACRNAGLLSSTIDWLVLDAQADEEYTTLRAEMRLWREEYQRGALTDREYRDLLGTVLKRGRAADLASALASISRRRKVYREGTTDAAKAAAKKGLAVYREAHARGLISDDVLRARLAAAGVDAEAAELMVLLGQVQLRNSMEAWARRYELPALRDQVVHGLLSPDEYRRKLRSIAFPGGAVEIEVAYAAALARRFAEGQVRAYELGPARQAYVAGLIGEDTLAAWLQEGGLDQDAIDAQIAALRDRRDRVAARAAAAAEAAPKRAAADVEADAAAVEAAMGSRP
jgi:hypothetical protein